MRVLVFLTVFFFAINSYAEEKPKSQFKIGIENTQGVIENHEFDINSYSVHIETSIYKEVGFGVGFIKEGSWAYDGYYLDFYGRYKVDIPKSIFYFHTTAGIIYGIPSKKYDHFDGNTWVYIKQGRQFGLGPTELDRTALIHPSLSFSLGIRAKGIPVLRKFSIEPGIAVNFMEFGIKRYEPFLDTEETRMIPTLRIRFVYNY